MSFNGQLSEIGPEKLIKTLASGRGSGKLSLRREEQWGLAFFDKGRLLTCRSNAVHQTLGSILVSRHIISETTLLAALDQQMPGDDVPLGTILLEMGAVTTTDLEAAVREQVNSVLSELLTWRSGTFDFEVMEIDRNFAAGLDVGEFLLGDSSLSHGNAPTPAEQESIEDLDFGDDSGEQCPSSLSSIMADLRGRSFTFTGEVTMTLLRFLAQIVNRAAIFTVRNDRLCGMGWFGIEIEGVSVDERVRETKIPLGDRSVLGRVIRAEEAYLGALEETPWNRYLVEQFGGDRPGAVMALPIIAGGKPVAVVYGDNLPEETPMTDLDGLAAVMEEVRRIIDEEQQNPP